jgi:integrase
VQPGVPCSLFASTLSISNSRREHSSSCDSSLDHRLPREGLLPRTSRFKSTSSTRSDLSFARLTGATCELTRAKASDVEDGVIVVSQTKSGRVRRVPLPAALAQELCFRVGQLVAPGSYWSFVLRMRRLSGVVHFHPHQLRHTFACRWLEPSGSLAALQQILGHAGACRGRRRKPHSVGWAVWTHRSQHCRTG